MAFRSHLFIYDIHTVLWHKVFSIGFTEFGHLTGFYRIWCSMESERKIFLPHHVPAYSLHLPIPQLDLHFKVFNDMYIFVFEKIRVKAFKF
jgi:hypothetical protein